MADGVDGLKKELAERVKHYEGKLATLTVINGQLQEENDDLRDELEKAQEPKTDAEEELLELQEEFTERLGEYDRKIAKLQDEKAELQDRLRSASSGDAASLEKLAEKDGMIQAYREEGEALARKQGELEGTIKKLRLKERDQTAEIQALKGRVASLEREVESGQQGREQLEDGARRDASGLRAELTELRSRYKVDVEKLREDLRSAEDRAHDEAARGGASKLQAALEREAAVSDQLDALRASLEQTASSYEDREDVLRAEVRRLEHRLRATEAEREEAAAQHVESSQPLLRQIEAMSAASAKAAQEGAEVERNLAGRLKRAEQELKGCADREKHAKARASAAEAAVAASKAAATEAVESAADARSRWDAERRASTQLRAELAEAEEREAAAERRAALAEASLAETGREREEAVWELEQARRTAAAAAAAAAEEADGGADAAADEPAGPRRGGAGAGDEEEDPQTPPTGAAEGGEGEGRGGGGKGAPPEEVSADELAGLYGGEAWEGGGRLKPPADTPARARSRESHVMQQLAEELAAAERARDFAGEQLFEAMKEAEALRGEHATRLRLQGELSELQRRFDYLLVVVGERNERVEALEEEAQDAKEVFRGQVEAMVEQINANQEIVRRLQEGQQERQRAEEGGGV